MPYQYSVTIRAQEEGSYLLQVFLKARSSVAPQYKPEFDAPESTTECYLPVAIIDDGSRIAFLASQEGLPDQSHTMLKPGTDRSDVQGISQMFAVPHVEQGLKLIGFTSLDVTHSNQSLPSPTCARSCRKNRHIG